jgi:phage terminase small subunit
MAKDTLTVKQEKFVQGLFQGMSQREAYKSAYNAEKMSDGVIDNKASLLAKKDEIRVRLQELQKTVAERNIVTVEWVIENLKQVAERCMQAEPVMIREGNEWVESGEYQFAHAGANRSLELIGKYLGMFTEKVEHTGKDGGPIQHEDVSLEEKMKLIESLKNT